MCEPYKTWNVLDTKPGIKIGEKNSEQLQRYLKTNVKSVTDINMAHKVVQKCF